MHGEHSRQAGARGSEAAQPRRGSDGGSQAQLLEIDALGLGEIKGNHGREAGSRGSEEGELRSGSPGERREDGE